MVPHGRIVAGRSPPYVLDGLFQLPFNDAAYTVGSWTGALISKAANELSLGELLSWTQWQERVLAEKHPHPSLKVLSTNQSLSKGTWLQMSHSASLGSDAYCATHIFHAVKISVRNMARSISSSLIYNILSIS